MPFRFFLSNLTLRARSAIAPNTGAWPQRHSASFQDPYHTRGSARRPGEAILPPFDSHLFSSSRHHYQGESSRQLTDLRLPDRLLRRKGQHRGTWAMCAGWRLWDRPASARFKDRTGGSKGTGLLHATVNHHGIQKWKRPQQQYCKTKLLTCKEATSSTRSSEPLSKQRRLGLITAAGINALF